MELNIFNYQDTPVRTVTVEGEPWFVLADLCKVLEITNARDVAARLDDDMKGVDQIDTLGGRQRMTIVSESGMYEVVIRSDKQEAVAFRRWITGVVLPAIRRTGSYGAAPALTEDEIMHQALQISARKVKSLEAKVSEDAPKVDYIDTFVADDDAMLFRTVASTLSISEAELRNALIQKGWIYPDTSRRFSESKGKVVERTRYAEYAHKKGYFYRRMDHDAPRFKGEVMWTLKVTPAGASAIARLIRKSEVAA